MPVAVRLRLGALATLLVAASVFNWTLAAMPTAVRGGVPAWTLLLATFMAAEALQFHIEIRKQAFSVSLSEIPLIVGVLLLGPVVTLGARLLAVVVVMIWRRNPVVKTVFNLCLFTFETSVFSLILVLLSAGTVDEPATWLAVVPAILVVNALSSSVVILVITWTTVVAKRRLLLDVAVPFAFTSIVNTAAALMVAVILDVSAWGGILMGVLGLLLVAGFRVYANSLHQHRNLGQVYDFAKIVERSTASTRGEQHTVEAVREMLNAERAAMWLSPTEQVPGRTAFAEADGIARTYDGPGDEADPLRERVMAEGAGRLFLARSGISAERDAVLMRDAREVIGVPLSSSHGWVGYLEVCNRQGDRLHFSTEDVGLMESLATHVSAAANNVQLLRELRYDATHDRLTGLPNRVSVADTVSELLLAIEGTGRQVAVIVLDLQTINGLNDTLGHEAGDALLTAVSTRLLDLGPDEAVVARMGGEEFAVVSVVGGLAAAEALAERLRALVSRPCAVAGVTVEVNASVGVAIGPEHGHTAAILLQRADVALYAGRAGGRDVTTYQPSMGESSLRRLYLGTQLREAMAVGQIFVVFQPQLHLATSTIRSAETLVRWEHPRYGAVSPEDFIPLAEQIGMMTPLTLHVLTLALWRCRSWLDRGMRIAVSVNLSARTLGDPEFPGYVQAVLDETGVSPDLLCLEITESSVMTNPEVALPVLHDLHARGISLSVDDFGTGHSSLAYLGRLPVDEVKIDKSFVQQLGTEMSFMAITRTIIDLVHGLGMRVVAEGVEDELTRDLLADMGCDTIQGYLVSRPLTAERLDKWLQVRSARPADGDVDDVVIHLAQPETL